MYNTVVPKTTITKVVKKNQAPKTYLRTPYNTILIPIKKN